MNRNIKIDEIGVLNIMFPDRDTEAIRFVGHQINVIDEMGNRLMTLGGILLAITAAILPNISKFPFLSKIFFIVGSSLVLISILAIAWFVFRVKWITEISSDKLELSTLKIEALRIRNKKTKGYHIAVVIIIAGLMFYLLSLYAFFI